MRRKDYYTKRQIAMAWIKKKLGIVSPSALYTSDGKYKYAYDYIMEKGEEEMNYSEVTKAIEKYQKQHPLRGATIDVTAISSKEGADIVSQTIENISKQVKEDTELWCICEMAKMYMRGVRPVYQESYDRGYADGTADEYHAIMDILNRCGVTVCMEDKQLLTIAEYVERKYKEELC